jgi:hypothetical protein
LSETLPTFVDLLAGSGLVTQGARHACVPVWSNDICPKKAASCTSNHGDDHFHLGSIEQVSVADLPPHDPTRYETTDGSEDPRCTNGDRATVAAASLAAFQISCGMTEDVETAAADLICNLLHLVYAQRSDPLDVLQSGIRHFLCEATEVNLAHS